MFKIKSQGFYIRNRKSRQTYSSVVRAVLEYMKTMLIRDIEIYVVPQSPTRTFSYSSVLPTKNYIKGTGKPESVEKRSSRFEIQPCIPGRKQGNEPLMCACLLKRDDEAHQLSYRGQARSSRLKRQSLITPREGSHPNARPTGL